MSQLVKIQFLPMPAMRVIGKSLVQSMDMQENPIPALWMQCFQDGSLQTLEKLPQRLDDAYVGMMCNWSTGKGTFTYICGMMMSADCPVPEGYVFHDCPAGTAAVGWIQGPEGENYQCAHELTQREMEKQGFRMDEDAQWCMELYNCPRFTQPMENGDVILDYYIPCKPQAR